MPWIAHRTNSSMLNERHLPMNWLYNFVRCQKLKYFGDDPVQNYKRFPVRTSWAETSLSDPCNIPHLTAIPAETILQVPQTFSLVRIKYKTASLVLEHLAFDVITYCSICGISASHELRFERIEST